MSRAQYRCSERRKGPEGGGYNALPEGYLCRMRPGQPGSSANLTPTKRGSALRRRSRQDSSQRVIKFQVSTWEGSDPHSYRRPGGNGTLLTCLLSPLDSCSKAARKTSMKRSPRLRLPAVLHTSSRKTSNSLCLAPSPSVVIYPEDLLSRIMQEIRIRVDWGPEKMP